MQWDAFLADWRDQIDRVHTLFPMTDPCALSRFRGNRLRLAEYIADAHDLTLREGMEAIETRLLPGATCRAAMRMPRPAPHPMLFAAE